MAVLTAPLAWRLIYDFRAGTDALHPNRLPDDVVAPATKANGAVRDLHACTTVLIGERIRVAL